MLKPYLLCLVFITFSINSFAVSVNPETTTNVVMSNKDVNRLVCQSGSINDVYFSQEKGINVTVNEQNAFVKFFIKNDGIDNSYIDIESEFHVVCNGEIYTLLAHPENIEAQTIYLGNPTKSKIQDNILLYAALPIEEQAIDLTKRTIKDELPDSFNVINIPADQTALIIDAIKSLELIKTREVSIEGVGLKLSEYSGISKASRQLSETQFLNLRFGKNILAVTVDPLNVKAGGGVHVYVVEKTFS